MKRSPQRHPLKDRKDDCYPTAPEAVRALLAVERVPHVIWEPCSGPGAIVKELRASGYRVHATDLVDYGLEDSESGIDFLMEWRAPPDTQCILTNPPNKLATQFAEHALRLCPFALKTLLRRHGLKCIGIRRAEQTNTHDDSGGGTP
jgi:hypothetical protein